MMISPLSLFPFRRIGLAACREFTIRRVEIVRWMEQVDSSTRTISPLAAADYDYCAGEFYFLYEKYCPIPRIFAAPARLRIYVATAARAPYVQYVVVVMSR